MSSPTQRSLANLRKRGYTVAVVERWIPGCFIRQDLFGLFDLIGIRKNETIAVQTTSDSNLSSRIKKIADSDKTALVRDAGWRIEAHGWKKVKGRWAVRVVDCS